MAMNDFSPADIKAITGGNGDGDNDGLGGDNGILWLLLFIILGGFGGNRGWGGGGSGGGYGAGSIGGNELYPWLNQSEQISGGFAQQALGYNVQGIQSAIAALSQQLCGCCGDMQMAVANGFAGTNANVAAGFNGVNAAMAAGFAGVEAGANARATAAMQQAFAQQAATTQGFTGLQAQLADCCCENRLATANQTATILAENCADRAAISDGVRDIIASQTAGTQAIIDKLCALELDGVRAQLDAERRENAGLQNQLNMANLAASQAAQNAFIQQGFSDEVDALYDRLSNCPVPSMPVYGRTPIFTCQSQNPGCGCGCGM